MKKHFGWFSNRVKSTVTKTLPITQVKETSTMPLFTRKMLGDAGIGISMAKICLENPYAERVYATVKNDSLAAYNINTPSGLKKGIAKSRKELQQLPAWIAQGNEALIFR